MMCYGPFIMPDGLTDTNKGGGSAEAPAALQAPHVPQGSPEQVGAAGTPLPNLGKMSPHQRMLAQLKSERASKAPTTPAQGASVTAAAAEAPLDPVAAKVADVAKKLEAKRAQAAAEREAASKQSEAAQLEAKISAARLDPELLRSEKGRDHLVTWAAATGVDPIALFDALSDLGEQLERDSKANPLEKRLTTLEKEREAEAARKAAEAKATREADARKAFLGTVSAEKFPLLSALGEDEIMARGIAAATALAESDEDADAETIAALAEMELRKLHGKLAAKGSEKKTAGSAEPRTLSSSLGGETPEPPKFQGKDGPLLRMKAHLRARG